MSGTDRLLRLLALADQGPVMRAALAEEVAELLIDWPADCPMEMRKPCEALLARAAREVDEDVRARLRSRLYADPALCARLLPREAGRPAAMARPGESPVPCVAQALGISERLADDILRDQGGRTLAVAAKALGLNRAAFSALALLALPAADLTLCYARLDAFDAVSMAEASCEWRCWSVRHAA